MVTDVSDGGRDVATVRMARALAKEAIRRAAGAERERTALTPDEANAQFREEVAKLEFPPDWSQPHEPFPRVAVDGAGIMYGPGTGADQARLLWRCAWYRVLLEADSEVERLAVFERLARVPDAINHPGIAEAKAGDLSALARFVELNCPACAD